MAKSNKNNKEDKVKARRQKNSQDFVVAKDAVQSVTAIGFFLLALIFILAYFNLAGIAGRLIYKNFSWLMGLGYTLLPLASFLVGMSILKKDMNKKSLAIKKVIWILIFVLASLGIIEIVFEDKGGWLGKHISYPLIEVLDVYATLTLLWAVVTSSILLSFNTGLPDNFFSNLWHKIRFWRKDNIEYNEEDVNEIEKLPEEDNETKVEIKEANSEAEEQLSKLSETKDIKNPRIKVNKAEPKEVDDADIDHKVFIKMPGKQYIPPPLSILERDKGRPVVGDIKANSNIIKRTLQNFGITVEMDEVSIGPSVTRYALKPAEGVKLSKIIALQDNLSYALAAHPIRIEAPIPGKSLVGIEIPNSTKTLVGLASMFNSEEYQKSDKPLLISLGKDISGKPHFGNLAKMPHLLIAGATGSGKSVTIHTIINSLIYRNSPDSLKFIMIDPKRVELTLYNKIPHLLTPVVTDAKKAILALRWAAKEMDRRYDLLEEKSVRDIQSYHKTILEPTLKELGANISAETEIPDLMPYIVIIIDELADIMSTYPRELEAAVVRLAQMSRAVGIHLILSTQRPSVNVITGLIKANIPARIALQVASQVDSRTILDSAGAEKLLGAGDMLYLGGDMAKPQRLQSAYISEQEVKKTVKYLRDNYADEIPEEINFSDTQNQEERTDIFEAMSDEVDDDLYEAAKAEVEKAGKASTSYIQRKLRIGYARAARIMDMLEQRGIIGPADGAKPREVLTKNSAQTQHITDDNIENSRENP
jgi:S-DNA-T family DNA segregation ATPase FtsK/SpoIIIE